MSAVKEKTCSRRRNSRLGRTTRSRLALSATRCDNSWTEGPLLLASSIAFIVLSGATKIGVGGGLLRGHGCGVGTVGYYVRGFVEAGFAYAVMWSIAGSVELGGHLDVCVFVRWFDAERWT